MLKLGIIETIEVTQEARTARAATFPKKQPSRVRSADSRPVVLEMAEITLVDVEAVRFLGVCETQGIKLRHCPAYIRAWIARERVRKVQFEEAHLEAKAGQSFSTWMRIRR